VLQFGKRKLKTSKAVIALVIIVLAVGIWAVIQANRGEPTQLVAAWQLTPNETYSSSTLVDPVASWSPDSKSLLFTGVGVKARRTCIYLWHVGEKSVTPHRRWHLRKLFGDSRFIYYKMNQSA